MILSKYTIGVDVGGTNVKLGLVNAAGRVVSRSRLNTKSYIANRNKLIGAIVQSIKDIIKANQLSFKNISGVGFGLPGLIDSEKGVVIFLPNIPGWKNVPLVSILEQKLNLPVFIENDVNLITLGEWKFGAGKGCHNLVCITLGTGVGGGLILDNRLYRGEGFVAGEIGHMPLNEAGPHCNCGGMGCFERYVGNKKLQKKAAKIFHNSNIQLPDVFQLAEKGDKRAVKFWRDIATHIGNGLIGVVNLLNPRLIIIGGGVSNNFKYMQPAINQIIKNRAMKVQGKMVRVVRTKLADDAGIIGAHVLVYQ